MAEEVRVGAWVGAVVALTIRGAHVLRFRQSACVWPIVSHEFGALLKTSPERTVLARGRTKMLPHRALVGTGMPSRKCAAAVEKLGCSRWIRTEGSEYVRLSIVSLAIN